VLVPPVLLLLTTVAVAVWPGVGGAADRTGAAVTDTTAYADAVLHGAAVGQPAVSAEPLWHLSSVGLGLLAVGLAMAFAAACLWPGRRPRPVEMVLRPVARVVQGLHVVHRAHVGDYISWVLIGFTVLGATLLLS
jgi:hypothetical protein